MELSKNFTLEELIHSNTAIKKGINNDPNELQVSNLKRLVIKVLQPTRDFLGVVLISASGFRCHLLNTLIGGASGSQHEKGEADDLKSSNGNNKSIFDYIKDNLEFDQLIWEFGTDDNPAWVHVSIKEFGNRKQILKAIKVGGKTKYLKI